MKKTHYAVMAMLAVCATLQGCGTKNAITESSQPALTAASLRPSETAGGNSPESGITQEMAYEGVYNYCRDAFDWSAAEDDASLMYVTLEDETESEYKFVFRSYTGSFVYFFVDKTTGTTRMTEYVPALEIENDAGTIELFDYLKK